MIPDSNEWITISKIMDINNFILIDALEDTTEYSFSIEEPITQKIMFDKLSGEAKNVIRLIINAPQEILDIWSTKERVRENEVTRRKTRRYIRTMFAKKADQIIKEIERYVQSIT